MSWKKLRESTKASLNDHLRLRNEYLMAENRILRSQIDGRVQLTDNERKELAAIGAKLGKKALAEIATVAQPETILAWNRKFANQPADTSKRLKSVGRPCVDKEIEDLVVRMARKCELPSDHLREGQCRARDNVVFLSVVQPRPIQDGPVQCRLQFRTILRDDERRAACLKPHRISS